MRPRAILFLIGLIVLLLGAVPLIVEFFPAAAAWKDTLPPAGSLVYQSTLVIIGVVAMGHAIKSPGRKLSKKELMKALG